MPKPQKRTGRRSTFRLEQYADDPSSLPDDLVSQIRLAQAMLARREYRPAYEMLQQLDTTYPDSVELQYLRMELGTTLSDLSLIVRAGERLTQLRPDEADAHWNLAMAHLRMEHPALTVQELRQYLEYAPNGPSAPAAHRMIAELGYSKK